MPASSWDVTVKQIEVTWEIIHEKQTQPPTTSFRRKPESRNSPPPTSMAVGPRAQTTA